MHEVIEGLPGIEVVADDFVAVGFGETLEHASCNRDDHLEGFLQQCDEKNLKLNDKKIKLMMQEVPFIGHLWFHTLETQISATTESNSWSVISEYIEWIDGLYSVILQ